MSGFVIRGRSHARRWQAMDIKNSDGDEGIEGVASVSGTLVLLGASSVAQQWVIVCKTVVSVVWC